MSDHYFSPSPTAPDQHRTVTVRLGDRELALRTSSGVFSPGGLDKGTAVLLGAVPPPPPTGHLLDLGCGWGPIALSLALASPSATVWAVDVNPRSLELTRHNAELAGVGNVRACAPDEVPDDVSLGAIWSNPPIHIGKAALHELLLHWLPRLAPGAAAQLVVQKHLGSDSLATWLAATLPERTGEPYAVRRTASKSAFRVLEVLRPPAAG